MKCFFKLGMIFYLLKLDTCATLCCESLHYSCFWSRIYLFVRGCTSNLRSTNCDLQGSYCSRMNSSLPWKPCQAMVLLSYRAALVKLQSRSQALVAFFRNAFQEKTPHTTNIGVGFPRLLILWVWTRLICKGLSHNRSTGTFPVAHSFILSPDWDLKRWRSKTLNLYATPAGSELRLVNYHATEMASKRSPMLG